MPAFDLLATPPRVAQANFYPFRPGERAGPHWSESDLFLAVIEGRGEIRVGERSYAVSRGQIVHVPWTTTVRYDAPRADPFVVIGVHLVYRAWSAPPVGFPHHDSPERRPARHGVETPWPDAFLLEPRGDSRVVEIATAITRAFERDDADREALCRALAIEFLNEVRRCLAGDVAAAQHPLAGRVREILSYLELAYPRRILRGELAQRAGISESSLSSAFRAVTGRSPIDHLIHLRLAHARHLLRTSRLGIAEIGQQVGIADIAYFSKLFRRRTGCSPLQYRKRQRF
ncbi:MAG TPA: AraC family transcriptional regulator [Planctomycetota bacterium]|nr:AraC family transcriptional regulator [Planctomycetota bacterium]